MKLKPTYQELENQISECKKQIEFLQLNSTFKVDKKNNQTDELIIAKERAEEDKERLDFVLYGSNLGYWDWNIETKEVKRNKRWAEMLGYTFDEILLTVNQWVDFIHPEDRDRAWESIKNHLEGKTTFHQLEYRMLTKDGQVKWVLDSAKIVKRDKKGKPLRMSGTHLDITDRKKFEEALKKSETELRESNATKDKFFSIIAHDLKSPFNSMLGFSNVLNENFDKFNTEKKKRFIGLIYEGLQGTHKLLENLLQWSMSQKGVINFNVEKINLYFKVEEICVSLNQSAKNKSIQIINQIDKNVYVAADTNMLATIIRNLLSNAIKYTHKDGHITIKTFLVPNENNNEYLGISVSDSGIGIPKEKQLELFDIVEYKSTIGTENEKGTGLGLILCKEFVKKHGGKIWVDSELDKGTTFYFTIPKN